MDANIVGLTSTEDMVVMMDEMGIKQGSTSTGFWMSEGHMSEF